jgi:hypothetical protein
MLPSMLPSMLQSMVKHHGRTPRPSKAANDDAVVRPAVSVPRVYANGHPDVSGRDRLASIVAWRRAGPGSILLRFDPP